VQGQGKRAVHCHTQDGNEPQIVEMPFKRTYSLAVPSKSNYFCSEDFVCSMEEKFKKKFLYPPDDDYSLVETRSTMKQEKQQKHYTMARSAKKVMIF
jgi:hypothetical protein